MEFTPRMKQILIFMLKNDGILSVQKIADELRVSKRTVQREFQYLEAALRKYNITMETKQGSGVWLSGEAEDKENLKDRLACMKKPSITDKEERRKYLIYELLKEREPQKLYYYSEKLGVSEATASSDLEAVKDWFLESSLQIVKRQGYGISLNGTEKNYRFAMHRFIHETMDDEIIKYMQSQYQMKDKEGVKDADTNAFQLLQAELLMRVSHCLNGIKNLRRRRLTEQSYSGFIIHMAIAVHRILNHETIEDEAEIDIPPEEEEEYGLAKEIVSSLENEFQIQIPSIEYPYILLHIKGAKLQSISRESAFEEQLPAKELLHLVNLMIDAFDSSIAYQLKCDDDFIQGMLWHLKPTIIRLKNGMYIHNPLLSVIKNEYKAIFQKTIKAAAVLHEACGFPINEHEIGYLSMHFGAAAVRLEGQRSVQRKVEIGIICASGIGVARLMLVKLKNYLKNRANIMTYSREDIAEKEAAEVDFYVSSLTLDDLNVDYIKVSPLLPLPDLEQIQAKVQIYAYLPKGSGAYESIEQMDNLQLIQEQMKRIVQNFFVMEAKSDICFDQLLNEIGIIAATDKRGAEIICEDLMRRENMISQIIPEYKFALLHCRTNGVTEPLFFICAPNGAQMYEEPYFHGIESAVVMLIPKNDRTEINTEIMGYLTSCLLEDDQFLALIIGGDQENIRRKLWNLLKLYFERYIG